MKRLHKPDHGSKDRSEHVSAEVRIFSSKTLFIAAIFNWCLAWLALVYSEPLPSTVFLSPWLNAAKWQWISASIIPLFPVLALKDFDYARLDWLRVLYTSDFMRLMYIYTTAFMSAIPVVNSLGWEDPLLHVGVVAYMALYTIEGYLLYQECGTISDQHMIVMIAMPLSSVMMHVIAVLELNHGKVWKVLVTGICTVCVYLAKLAWGYFHR